MCPYHKKSLFLGKIMIKQKLNDLFSNLMVKCWQSGKNVYPTMSAVAAAGSQTETLILKKVQ